MARYRVRFRKRTAQQRARDQALSSFIKERAFTNRQLRRLSNERPNHIVLWLVRGVQLQQFHRIRRDDSRRPSHELKFNMSIPAAVAACYDRLSLDVSEGRKRYQA